MLPALIVRDLHVGPLLSLVWDLTCILDLELEGKGNRGGPHRYKCAKLKEIKIIWFFRDFFSILLSQGDGAREAGTVSTSQPIIGVLSMYRQYV